MIEEYTAKGYRVLVFALYHGTADGKMLTEEAEPLLFTVLSNRIRSDAKQTFEYFEEQGVDIRVISGDSPLTASNAALKAGVRNAESYIDATELKTDDEISAAAEKFRDWYRVKKVKS